MTTSRGRQIVLAARPKGKPELTDFRLEETAIPTAAGGQLLLEVQYLSLDPYMRGRMNDGKSYATPLQIGAAMTGETVAQVLVSNHSQYVKGTSSPRKPDGARTRSRTARAFGNSIRLRRPSRPVSACSECPGSRRTAACARSANRSPERPWLSPRPAVRSGHSSDSLPSSPAREPWASPAARKNVPS